ncbi:MAG: hypothetical protein Q8R91_07305 [Candidatus Omnitrophota bacterium]|nr:hypothetical protein [Candidatus Omnitrophota bacterium]
MKRFKYQPATSAIFGTLKRPLVSLEFYSSAKSRWFTIANLLADTGADLSILPRAVGELLLGDIRHGQPLTIRGIVPRAVLHSYLHRLQCRFNGRTFWLITAIAESEDVTAIVGRVGGLDRLIATFVKGREVRLGL